MRTDIFSVFTKWTVAEDAMYLSSHSFTLNAVCLAEFLFVGCGDIATEQIFNRADELLMHCKLSEWEFVISARQVVVNFHSIAYIPIEKQIWEASWIKWFAYSVNCCFNAHYEFMLFGLACSVIPFRIRVDIWGVFIPIDEICVCKHLPFK